MRFLDTGSADPDHTLGKWLESGLSGSPRGLWMQSGYFGYESLAIHDSTLRQAANAGFPLHFVLGANQGSLVAEDVKRLVATTAHGADSSVTVISFANALFHPKTYIVKDAAGDYHAYVGSANMTGPGIGLNVESGVALSTAEGDSDTEIGAIRNSIKAWAGREQDGVFRVNSMSDVDELVEAGILSLTAIPRHRFAVRGTGPNSTTPNRSIGRRRNLYPIAPLAPFAADASTLPMPTPTGSAFRWSKEMAPSDAQQVGKGTNPTGKLRLAKAGHAIDHKVWFREEFFDGIEWTSQMRDDLPYEVALVPFNVTIYGSSLGLMTLTIDHAPHRVAGQNNVPTVLAWGPELGRILVTTSYTGSTVTLERTTDGSFNLEIS